MYIDRALGLHLRCLSSLLLHLYLEGALGLRLRELLAAALRSPQLPEVVLFTIDHDRVIIVRLAFIFTYSKNLMYDNDSATDCPLFTYPVGELPLRTAHEHLSIHT